MIGVMALGPFRAANGGMPATHEAVDAGALFEQYHPRIYRYLLHMIKDPAEAEDLTQDTFLRAYDRRETLRDPDAVRGWLYRIATRLCLDRLRQRKPQLSIDGEEAPSGAEPMASRSASVVEVTERKETSACVQRCLDYLPDSYRAVILLREAHSLTAVEIADVLGVTVMTVKIRLHRARRKLQKIMECGCAVSNDNEGRPVCEPKSSAHR